MSFIYIKKYFGQAPVASYILRSNTVKAFCKGSLVLKRKECIVKNSPCMLKSSKARKSIFYALCPADPTIKCLSYFLTSTAPIVSLEML